MSISSQTGRLRFLRVNDVGGGYGPPSDFIDVEAVCSFDPTQSAFGFTLRNDDERVAHQGMLDLLRDAYANSLTVTIDYDLPPGKRNGRIIRVALQR